MSSERRKRNLYTVTVSVLELLYLSVCKLTYSIYINNNNLFSNYNVCIYIFTDLLVNIAFISVVPGESILGNDNIDETIAVTFFHKLFGKSDVIVRIFTVPIALSIIGTAAASVWR